MNIQIRQGDILLVSISEAEMERTQPQKRDSQYRIVLATGESTGHAHVIDSPHAALYGDKLEERFLEIVKDVELVHTSGAVPDHDTLTIPEGFYRVVRQREYTPEAIRVVAD